MSARKLSESEIRLASGASTTNQEELDLLLGEWQYHGDLAADARLRGDQAAWQCENQSAEYFAYQYATKSSDSPPDPNYDGHPCNAPPEPPPPLPEPVITPPEPDPVPMPDLNIAGDPPDDGVNC
jgi:hypothetical protein